MPEMLSFANWIDIPHPGVTEAWVDFDLNTVSCPVDTIGVICYYIRPSTGANHARCGIRPNGSTDSEDEFYDSADGNTAFEARYIMSCGCDVNKIIETHRRAEADWNTSGARLAIIGWIKSGEAVLLTNAVAATWTAGGPTAQSWEECHFDSAIQGEDTPQAWLLALSNTHWNADDLQARPAGSTYSIRTSYQYQTHIDRVVGVGTNNRLDVWIDDLTDYYVGVRGYYLTGYTSLYDSPIDLIPLMPGMEQWATVNLSSVPVDAIVIIENDSNSSSSIMAAREVGSADSGLPRMGAGPNVQMVSVGATQQIEFYYRWGEVRITGYIEGTPPVTPPSYSDISDELGKYVERDLSGGWTNHADDDYSAIALPYGTVMDKYGIVTGYPLVAPASQRYELDFGEASYIQVLDDQITPQRECTIIMDIWMDSGHTSEKRFFGVDSTLFFRIDPHNNYRLACYIGNQGNWPGDSYFNLTPEKWTQITIYLAGDSGKETTVDMEGGLLTYVCNVGTTNTTRTDFTIGNYSPWVGASSWPGKIRNFRLFDGDAREAGATPYIHYPIHDNGTTAVDHWGNKNSAITVGGTWVDTEA